MAKIKRRGTRKLTKAATEELARFAELKISPIAVAEMFSAVVIEIGHADRGLNPAEIALAADLARKAFRKSLMAEDSPDSWVAAARAAANLD